MAWSPPALKRRSWLVEQARDYAANRFHHIRDGTGGGVSATSITVRVPLSIRRRPGRKTVVTPNGEIAGPVLTRADPALLKALARAFRWQRLLDEGRYGSISEMAAAERIERGYLGKVLQLTLLAPAVVEAIVNGRQGEGVMLPTLLQSSAAVWRVHLYT